MKIPSGRYILDGNGEPVPCPNLLKWAVWFEDNRSGRVVRQERVGGLWVSTVFLALDHRFGDGPPILWETMVFKWASIQARKKHKGSWQTAPGMGELQQDRCGGSREQALAMHAAMIRKITERKCERTSKKIVRSKPSGSNTPK